MTRQATSLQELASNRRLTVLPQETLVNDSRAGLTPSQMVERKLRRHVAQYHSASQSSPSY